MGGSTEQKPLSAKVAGWLADLGLTCLSHTSWETVVTCPHCGNPRPMSLGGLRTWWVNRRVPDCRAAGKKGLLRTTCGRVTLPSGRSPAG